MQWSSEQSSTLQKLASIENGPTVAMLAIVTHNCKQLTVIIDITILSNKLYGKTHDHLK